MILNIEPMNESMKIVLDYIKKRKPIHEIRNDIQNFNKDYKNFKTSIQDFKKPYSILLSIQVKIWEDSKTRLDNVKKIEES